MNNTVAIATERLTADTAATVDSTPIRRSAMANAMMMGVAVISPICASLIGSFVVSWNRRMYASYDGAAAGMLR